MLSKLQGIPSGEEFRNSLHWSAACPWLKGEIMRLPGLVNFSHGFSSASGLYVSFTHRNPHRLLRMLEMSRAHSRRLTPNRLPKRWRLVVGALRARFHPNAVETRPDRSPPAIDVEISRAAAGCGTRYARRGFHSHAGEPTPRESLDQGRGRESDRLIQSSRPLHGRDHGPSLWTQEAGDPVCGKCCGCSCCLCRGCQP